MIPYYSRSRVKVRRQKALERLQKRISVLAKSPQASDSAKLEKATEEAATLIKRISGG